MSRLAYIIIERVEGMTKLGVIVGSIRPNNMSSRVGKWVAATAAGQFDEVKEINLGDYPLPLFAEAMPPLANKDRQVEPDVQKWLDAVAECDVVVMVTPEYNHSVPGALKNALDYLDSQVMDKQIGIVSHGSVGGARAAEHLRLVLESNLGGRVIPSTVAIQHREAIGSDGVLAEGYAYLADALAAVLSGLKRQATI